MTPKIQVRSFSFRDEITPDLIWSKYSIIQQFIFWILAVVAWHLLHWMGSTYQQFTIPIWRYTMRVRSYFYTGDFTGMVLLGLLSGAGILAVLLASDYVVAKARNEPPLKHILRNRHILPRTRKQQHLALLIGINAGLFEELFFRGGIFTFFLFVFQSTEIAILLTSVIFAMLHAPLQGWYSIVLIFLVGVFLNLLLLQTGSYYAPIFCHIMINMGNLFLIPVFFEEKLPDQPARSAFMKDHPEP